MATKQTSENITIRETATEYRGKPLIIELHPGYMVIRRKREQGKVMLPYDTAYETALKIEARDKLNHRS